ncbi:hypothetical protein AURDEDRAFT_185965 [Auricularia subglabra TFB-10046 SS5]|nr:hypothetical protein AURDEDRAFT_185965 [Auricularia subglabra TFB-10046 SS5]
MLPSIMGLFLSTSSRLRQLAPPAPLSPSARQADSQFLQPPFTEIPFDGRAADVARTQPLLLKDVSSIRFLGNFGRALFWSAFEGYESLPGPAKRQLENWLMSLTEAKLIGSGKHPTKPWQELLKECKNSDTAMMDVRLWIFYDPHKSTPTGIEAQLVAGNLRLAYTVPLNREYFYSGYSSEPLLAEAAARQMRSWMQGGGASPAWNPLETLMRLMDGGLLDRGERGELVARYLMMRAYDEATRHLGICSTGCSLAEFLRALFSDNFARQILAAKADNVAARDAPTLEKALGGGIVRFTHFAKLGDESGITTRGLCAAFIRCAAFIAQPNQAFVDVLIPILLDPTQPITPSNMSAVLIQVKRRVRAGAPGQYDFTAEQLGVFGDSDPPKPKDPLRQRPYCTLLMELGVKVKPSGQTSKTNAPAAAQTAKASGQATKAASKAKAAGKAKAPAAAPAGPSLNVPPPSPAKLSIGQGPERRSPRGKQPPKHPRYNIRAYGCSNTVYKVIKKDEKAKFAALLLGNMKWSEEHHRQSLRDCVEAMLPTWTAENAYSWVPKDERPLGDDERAEGVEEGVQVPEYDSDANDDDDDEEEEEEEE